MFLKNWVACVASVSNRVIARKLEREQKKKQKQKQKQKKSTLPVKYLIILSNAAFQARTLQLLFLEHGCLATHQSNL